jgi:nucleoid DNA-binding protein
MSTIHKSQLIEELAAELGITASLSEKYLNHFIQRIYNELRAGNKVNIHGFGQFSVSFRKSRVGIHPRTHKALVLPDLNTPKFVSGEAFKAAIKLRRSK